MGLPELVLSPVNARNAPDPPGELAGVDAGPATVALRSLARLSRHSHHSRLCVGSGGGSVQRSRGGYLASASVLATDWPFSGPSLHETVPVVPWQRASRGQEY